MIERTVVLPTRDNSGRPLSRDISQIKAELLSIAGGFSEVRQLGCWKDEQGHIWKDRALRLVTTVDENQDARIEACLPDWCARLRQLALYTHTTQVQVAFVEPAVAESQIA